MALFRGGDANLPFLTQLYQLEPYRFNFGDATKAESKPRHGLSLNEAEVFVSHFAASVFDKSMANDSDYLFEFAERFRDEPGYKDALEAFIQNALMFHRLMEHVANETLPDQDDTDAVNAIVANQAPVIMFLPRFIEKIAPEYQRTPGERIEAVANVGIRDQFWEEVENKPTFATFTNIITSRAGAELVGAIQRRRSFESPFPRCPVCQSLFNPYRTDQKYCSERCGNRFRVRKSRIKSNALDAGKTVTVAV